mmetsp:Transcript_67441/g.156564  ORF Transcript_67441/g.156564 Transcript_67441/m.156564 type:complete len:209 (-) Transcript_67441:318-944(-)
MQPKVRHRNSAQVPEALRSKDFELTDLEEPPQVPGIPKSANGRHLQVHESHVEVTLHATAVETVGGPGGLLQRTILGEHESVEQDAVCILGPDAVVRAAGHSDAHPWFEVHTNVRKLLHPRVVCQPPRIHFVRVEALQVKELGERAPEAADKVRVIHLEDRHGRLPVHSDEQVVGFVVVPPTANCACPEHAPTAFHPMRVPHGLLEVD